ncbi:MAG: tetratricopeptide repeat protein [Oceanicaulis sp.]
MIAGFDLDAELSKGREEAKRTVERERTGAARAIAAALEARGAAKGPVLKAAGLIRRAVNSMDNGPVEAAKAAKLCLKAIDAAPDFALAHQAMALCLERLGRLSSALGFYQRAYELEPGNPELYLNLGMLAWKLDMLDAAEKFLRLHNQMAPASPAGICNFAGLLRDKQNFADSIEILRAAIYAAPDNPELWNSLGTTLLESGDPHQAATFYQEALRLDPDYNRAHHNLAFCLDLMGDMPGAIRHFRTALSLNPGPVDKVTMEHGLSLALLSDGQLEEGWKLYEARLSPFYKSSVHFHAAAPFWSGEEREAIRGKRLLLVGEQGLGDEIMHATALAETIEAVGPDGAVGLVCEARLIGLFKRSFPELAFVGRHATVFREGRQIRSLLNAEPEFKPDLWAPLGSTQRAFRPTPESFPDTGAFFSPDPEKLQSLKAQVDALPDGLRVGFCWKSKLMKGNRTKYFSPFEMWRPVLQTPGCTFVSLQYGDTDAELTRCAKEFGVTIHTIDGLDLMNDLEGVGALGALMDVSVGQHNASLALASACGGETFLLSPSRHQWTSFGTDRHPWAPGSTVFAPQAFRDWADPIGRIADALAARARTAQRGAA